MKHTVRYQDKEYEVYAHSPQLVGNDLVEDYISSCIAKGHFYEEPLLSYLHDHYHKFDIVVDCGANIGNHAMFFTEAMESHVNAFELHPDNYRILCKNNPEGFNNNVALGARKGTTGYQSYPHNMGMTSVAAGNAIPVLTLDSFNLSPDFIKIDVEGMEDQVIQGALKTIKKNRPIMVVEHNDVQAIYRTGRVLEGLGYYIKMFPTETWEVFLYLPEERL